MKKAILFMVLSTILFFAAAHAQTSTSYKPYVSAGTSLSSGEFTYSGELGVYNEKTWFAVGAALYNPGSNWTAFTKVYQRVAHSGDISAFGTFAVNVALNESKAISIEPGAALVFNISERFAPQLSVSFPIPENTSSALKPLTTNFGLSLNYWLKR